MSFVILIEDDDAVVTHRFAGFSSVDVRTRLISAAFTSLDVRARIDPTVGVASVDVTGGTGTVAVIDILSAKLASIR